MPRNALRCMVEINLQAITCPGVWVPRRDDIFVSIRMFNQLRQTQLSAPIFPLLFHERFRFDKVFYTAFEPSHVADSLDSCTVLIELIQISDLYEGGRLLASYESTARDFLYPYPSFSATYGTTDRQVLMNRTLDFPGIAPQLEFSTRTVLKDTTIPLLDLGDDDILYSARSRSRSRSRSRTPRSAVTTYKRPTVSSITRSRSLSPALRHRLSALDLDDTPINSDLRPPFVVRKVNKDLIGRVPTPSHYNPGCDHTQAAKRRHMTSGSGSRTRGKGRSKHRKTRGSKQVLGHSYDDSVLGYRYGPTSRVNQVTREPNYGSRYPYFSDVDSEDLEVARLTTSDYGGYYTRPRTTSPLLYHSSLADRYDERPWSPAKSDLINSRVERALRRNRSSERLDLRSTSPYSNSAQKNFDETFEQLTHDFRNARLGSCTRTPGTEYYHQAVRTDSTAPTAHHHRDRLDSQLQGAYSNMYHRAVRTAPTAHHHRDRLNSQLQLVYSNMYQRARSQHLSPAHFMTLRLGID